MGNTRMILHRLLQKCRAGHRARSATSWIGTVADPTYLKLHIFGTANRRISKDGIAALYLVPERKALFVVGWVEPAGIVGFRTSTQPTKTVHLDIC